MIPTHGIYCYTKTYPTNCPTCSQNVFYFSCSCGSKVFFDDLGSPWPIHYCKKLEIVNSITLFKGSEYLTDIEIRRRIMEFARSRNFEIDEIAMEAIEEELGKHNNKLSFYDANLEKLEEDISGSIISINKEININKLLGVQKNSYLEKALLGDLFGKKIIEYKIREKPDKSNRCKQFLVYADETYVKKQQLRQNDYILGVVKQFFSGINSIYLLKEHLVI